MRLACQDNLVPGATFREKLELLARLGYDAVELQGAGILNRLDEIKAQVRDHPVQVAALCAGFRGSLLAPDRAEREQAYADIRALLEAAAELGAVGLIAVPIFAREPRVPDLSPWKTAVEVEYELLAVQWARLAEYAHSLGTLLLLEPLHRYHTHLINRLEEGAAFLRRLDRPGTALIADLFHMHIEEANTPAALRQHSDLLAYVHVCDSNRRLPGRGQLDFAAAFRALREIGYNGYLSVECIIDETDPPDTLAAAAQYLRAAWAAAAGR